MTHHTNPVAQFHIDYHQLLDEHGQPTGDLPDHLANRPDLWEQLYRYLVLTRVFDEKAVNLQRTGQMGTYPPNIGQEAVGVGIGAAMDEHDVLCPYYREIGAQLVRRVKMEEVFLYWGGDERGCDYADNAIDFPSCVPISTQCLHAAGVATAFKIRNEKKVAVATIGDGGTSKGEFYEAMNVAGVWELPVVFVIINNAWAISVPSKWQTRAETFAQKAIAAGVTCEQVDGNDIFAVYDATRNAIARAREHQKPHVIEAITYRMGNHTTADDATRYRPPGELEKAKHGDPIVRLRTFMVNQGVWNEEKEKALYHEIHAQVADAVHAYLATPKATPDSIFNYLYETLPEALHEQRDEVMAYFGEDA